MTDKEAIEAIDRLFVETSSSEEFRRQVAYILFQWKPENWQWM